MVGFAFDDRSERAQLILVGAVAIAFIVLGLAVVFNTVLYTENVASTGAASEPRDAQLLNKEIEIGVKRLTERVNAKGRFVSNSTAYTALTQNVSWYSTNMTEVIGAASPKVVSFGVKSTSADVTYGARIRDDDDSNFEGPGATDTKNWSLMTSSSGDAIVRDFDMTVNRLSLASANQKEAFHIVWRDPDTNDNHVVWVYRNSNDNVALRTVNNTANPTTDFSSPECELVGSESEEKVVFNFSDGSVQGYDDCDSQLGPWARIGNETPRQVEFYRADNVTGNYSLAMNSPGNLNADLSDPDIASSDPYVTADVWEFEVAVRYESGETSFTEKYYVEVYNRSR
ncbi:hypothetical protein [Halorubellus sp. PRR65]|uniref:DUF7261 family protein n=1 Tax=Halorubellus sp. PRR65 TaxID=3098148 RepID=UPI002B2636C5|nr:hypothetical protein [Halorubellus sp. PRR65]